MYLAKQHLIQHFMKIMQNTIEIHVTLLNVAFGDGQSANYIVPTIVEDWREIFLIVFCITSIIC